MTEQNYLLVNPANVVDNVVIWDGGPDWAPPAGYTALVQATTPAMVWELPTGGTAYVLTQVVGAGDIGFTWNGTVLTTNQPQPAYTATKTASGQPATTGTTTLGSTTTPAA